MPFTNYFFSQVLPWWLGKAAVATPPADLYVGLSSSQPTQYPTNNWNVTEPTDASYARATVANSTSSFGDAGSEPASGLIIVNVAAITFGESAGSWAGGALLDWACLFDAATAGNLLAYGQLNPGVQIIGAGYVPTIPANQAQFSMV